MGLKPGRSQRNRRDEEEIRWKHRSSKQEEKWRKDRKKDRHPAEIKVGAGWRSAGAPCEPSPHFSHDASVM